MSQEYNRREVYNTRNWIWIACKEEIDWIVLDCIRHFAKTVEWTLELYSIERFYPDGTQHSVTVFNKGNIVNNVHYDQNV